MANDPFSELYMRLLSDDALLDEFQQDPVGVIARYDIELTTEAITHLQARQLDALSPDDVREQIQMDGVSAWL